MNRTPRLLLYAGGVILTLALAWLLFIALPQWARRPAVEPDVDEERIAERADEPAPEQAAPQIKARLFYVSADGRRLEDVEREVPFSPTVSGQARAILEAQLQPVEEPLVSAIPPGVALREVFVTDRGEAYVDLTGEISTNHTGGSLDEILTVYTIVGALTENLPDIRRVQILIDGREVDTLAGHVDLRRPLSPDPAYLGSSATPAAEPQPEPTGN
ncbi:MAG TPA: GerMN domain-containing protein [Vicinamibacterales bacterium]